MKTTFCTSRALIALGVLASWACADSANATSDPPTRVRAVSQHEGAFMPTAAPSLDGSPVEYLVLTRDDLASEFARLAAWKTRKGVPAVVRTLDDVRGAAQPGSDLAETIRNYIRDAHELWGVRFVLLGGDTDVIPARYVEMQIVDARTPPSDLYYACLDGSWNADGDAFFGEEFVSTSDPGDDVDLISEVFLGRAPVSTRAEARVFVDKTLGYESPTHTDFQDRLLVLAEVLFPSNYTPGGPPPTADGAELAEAILLRTAPAMRVTRLYETQPLWPGSETLRVNTATAAVNSGYGTVVHVGHGWRYTLSTGDGSLDVRDAARFDNAGRAGLFYLLNCSATAFDFESMAEGLLNNPNGGACAVVGAARVAFPLSVGGYQNAFFEHLHQRGERQVGVAMARSRERFTRPGMSRIDRWTQLVYTLLGDPELPIWTRARNDLRVDGLPNALGVGAETVDLLVRNSDGPVANARVCVRKPGEEYRVAQTDASGMATLDLQLRSEGTVEVTVTAPDHRHVETTLPVRARGVSLALVETGMVDDGGASGFGNLDGRLDAGETARLSPRLRSAGTGTAHAVSATLHALDAEVDVLQGSVNYPDLSPGTVAGPLMDFEVRTSVDVPDGSVVRLQLDIQHADRDSTESRRIDLVVHAARPRVVGVRFDDTRAGNGDGVQDAGEEIDLYYSIENRGGGAALDVQIRAEAADPTLHVLAAQATFGDIAPGARMESLTPLTFVENDLQAAPSADLVMSHAQDPTGNRRRFDLRLPATPARPTHGQALTETGVRIVWQPQPDADLRGYHVYRADAPGGSFVRISSNVVPHASFEDTGLQPSTRYVYVVRAVDAAFLEGEPSAAITLSTNPGHRLGWPLDIGQYSGATPAVGDLDADGRLDVVVAADQLFAWNSHGVELVDGDQNPRTWGVLYGTDEGFGPLTVAHVDPHPGQEIVASTWDSERRHVVVLDAAGRPLPEWPQPLVAAPENVVGSEVPPVVADLDGDGMVEILLAARDGRLYGWHADGSEITDGDGTANTSGVLLDTGSAFLRSAPAVADLDPTRPGLEIVVGSTNGRLHVLDARGAAVPGWPRTAPAGGAAFGSLLASGITVADLDRDGMLEMIFVESTGLLHALHTDGAELAGFPVSGIAAQSTAVVPSPAIGDVQGNADLEIVAAGSDGRVHVLDSSGHALLAVPIATGNRSESSPILGDVDGDGAIEIVFGDEGGLLRAWNLDGSEVDGFPIPVGSEIRGTPTLADLDGDGKTELLVQGWDGTVRVHDLDAAWDPARFPWPTHRGNAARTGTFGAPLPTPIVLSELEARFVANDGVRVSWLGSTSTPNEEAVWNVRRAGPFDRDPGALDDAPAGPTVATLEGTGRLLWIDAATLPDRWYVYRVFAVEDGVHVLAGTASVSTHAPIALRLGLATSNPSHPITRMAIDVPGRIAAGVRLVLYDAAGRRVRVLVDAPLAPGRHTVAWDGRDERGRTTPSGIYFARLQHDRKVLSQKLMLLR